jgi:single-stranded-DNA-specific exonuclease
MNSVHRWALRAADEDEISALSGVTGLPRPVAAVCCGRGLNTAAKVLDFQRIDASRLHDPQLLPNMGAAADRVLRAIGAGERIGIYGHIDADGLCAAAIAFDGLRRLARGSAAQIVPIASVGYGRSSDFSLTTLRAARNERVSLLLSLDTGTRSVEAAARA